MLRDHEPEEIVVKDLHFSYPPLIRGGEPVPVLRGVDFQAARGEFIALLGRTGAGKSTLCMALNGLVPHATGGTYRGNVTVLGLNTKQQRVADLARVAGIVFQDPEGQLVQMRVEDEVAFGLENLGVPGSEIEERVTWALDAVGLTSQRTRPPLALSGGEKQRVAIAAMLAMQPRVLILDEPTASLDPAGKVAVFKVLARLRARHEITIFAAMHDMERIARYADRVLILHEGRIALEGPPQEVFLRAADLRELGLGVPQIAELADALSQATRHRYAFTTAACAFKDLRGVARKRRMHRLKVETPPPALPLQPFADQAQVSVEHVSYIYPDGTPALNDVSLVLHPGDFLTLLGPNGAGKSTLARHLNGLLKPAKGRVLVEDQDTRATPVSRLARTVGYAFQNPDHQIFAATVREEIAFGLQNQELPTAIINERVAETLARFQLAGQAGTPPALLGFGQRRKVALASVVAMKPNLLILDEPTGGLDWRSQHELMEIVAAFRAQGRTVVLITHDMRLVAEYAARAVILCGGRVLYDGGTRELFGRRDLLAQAQLALPPVTRLAQRLAADGMDPSVLSTNEFVTAWLTRLAAGRRHKKAHRGPAGKK